jgi:hypothetical protein
VRYGIYISLGGKGLTLPRLAVSLRTARFDSQQFCTVLALCCVLCVLCGSENRSRGLLYTSLADWFL